MEENESPNTDDFVPVVPIDCPICGKKMLHTELRLRNKRTFRFWMCDCEIQDDEDTMQDIRDSREESNDEVYGLVLDLSDEGDLGWLKPLSHLQATQFYGIN